MNTPQSQICPDDEVLQELAAGIGSPELAQQTMQHVAQCSECSAALRRYIKEFSDEHTPENIALINQLQSSKPQWQKRLVRELAGGRRFPWLKLVPALAALAIVIFAVIQGPALLVDYKVKRAQSDIAATFSVRRTTEGRMPGESYSKYNPRPTVLGAENGPGLDEIPASLHDATSAANQNLLAAKADPRWLQIQGLALLWEATPSSLEKAEKDFENARSKGLVTPGLEIDMAASYYERDSRAEHPNLQRTLNLLSEVLSKPALSKEDEASALFDLALAYEKTQAWDLAVSTWEKYLQVDSTSDWIREAQQHLKDAKAKISARPQQSYSDPSFFLQQKARGNLRPEDPEQYQQKALSQWLPAAMADKESDAYRAVSGLADVFAEHQDYWWRDFLKEIKPGDADAVRELSKAVEANDEGHYSIAKVHAQRAIALFSLLHNDPGALQASFEDVYVLRRNLNGADCIARADPLAKKLSSTSYKWLSASIQLAQSECRNISGKFDESNENLKSSRETANEFHFPVLMLKDVSASAGMQHLRGNCDESWREAVGGLGLYWQTLHTRGERLFDFYAVMLQCSLEIGALDAAAAFIRHAIALREDPSAGIQDDPTIDGLLHLHLANILFVRKNKDLAARERALALRMLNRLDEPSATKYRLVSELELAEFLLQQGDAEQSLATLDPLIALLPESQDKFFSLRCRKLRGDIYFKLNQYDQASAEYQIAIDLAEASLGSITNGIERLRWLRATDESYRGLVRVLLANKKDREALDLWEWYQGRPMLQVAAANAASQPATTQTAQLKKDAAAYSARSAKGVRVIYAEFKDGLQIWVLKDNNVKSHWIAMDQQDFEERVHDFIKKCATETSSLKDLQQQGQALYLFLVLPILNVISTDSVITVELDRRFYNLPVEALRSPKGWYLGEKYGVVYSSGIEIDSSLHALRPITLQEPLLLLDATHSPQAGFLPGMDEENKAVLETFPHAISIDAKSARWPNVRQSLARSEVVHYMGHGLPDGTGTRLLFNESHSLRAQDFTPDLFKRSQLVVLAACSSGKGQNGLLDTDNLVHALLVAGVPQVIASQWNVDSESTSQFMQDFYRGLAKDKTVAQSMLNARREMVKREPHPYYWAGFSLAGANN
jgi:CHAT domain-containing protein